MLDQYQALIAKHAAQSGVPIAWIQAVIMTESSGRADAFRAEPRINDASYGLMQVLYKTARGLGYTGTPEGLFDPDLNIGLGARLLAQLRARYGDSFDRVYSAYNSGSPTLYLTSSQVRTHVERARSWLQRIPTSSDRARSGDTDRGDRVADKE